MSVFPSGNALRTGAPGRFHARLRGKRDNGGTRDNAARARGRAGFMTHGRRWKYQSDPKRRASSAARPRTIAVRACLARHNARAGRDARGRRSRHALCAPPRPVRRAAADACVCARWGQFETRRLSEVARQLVARQPRTRPIDQFGPLDRHLVDELHIEQDFLLAHVAVHADGGAGLYGRMIDEYALDLPGGHVLAAHACCRWRGR